MTIFEYIDKFLSLFLTLSTLINTTLFRKLVVINQEKILPTIITTDGSIKKEVTIC